MLALGIIPARLAATRLPNKPLLDLEGKPMIQRVWERARASAMLDDLVVATPDELIAEEVRGFGGNVLLTSNAHRSGTDRCAEAAAKTECDIVVNIQGDEPFISAADIDAVVTVLVAGAQFHMASLMCACPENEFANPACVKVVCGLDGRALYFSRAPIPFQRAPGGAGYMQHVGLYAYRAHVLAQLAALPPSPLELAESLEQLRALENGYTIGMAQTSHAPTSVDTPEGLERVRAELRAAP